MPELPEVETTIAELRTGGLVGSTVSEIAVGWERTVGGDATRFAENVLRRTIVDISRRGKFIVMPLRPGGALLGHLRMSGRLYLETAETPLTGYERVVLSFETGRQLRFYDPRKFGRLEFVTDPATRLDRLGIEPLSPAFTPETLGDRLAGRARRIKPLLLDQTVVAGLGNIYTDEALWHATIHPERAAGSLTAAEVAALAEAIRVVLERGIRNLGTRLGTGASNFVYPGRDAQAHNQEELKVFQRTGQPCSRCGTPITRIIVGQRSTHVCPACQRPAKAHRSTR
jgi:formamidopyrimidine-DNA glycosylase